MYEEKAEHALYGTQQTNVFQLSFLSTTRLTIFYSISTPYTEYQADKRHNPDSKALGEGHL